MKLTTKGRYAVTAMVDFAAHAGDRPVALAEIAERQCISLASLEQLFAKLRRAGMIRSARGPGGGYRLRQPAAETRIADFVRAVDDPIECDTEIPEACRDDPTGHLTSTLWQALNAHIRNYFGIVSLKDVLEWRVFGATASAVSGPALLSTAPSHGRRRRGTRRS